MKTATVAVILVAIGALAAGALLPAARYRVEGLSMLPGLPPGSVVRVGWQERARALSPPERYDRWLVRAPDGARVVKRVMGLPGERVALVAGDVAIDGRPLLTPPRVLGELAAPVAAVIGREEGEVRLAAAGPVLDDCPEALAERRLLLPVRDGGVWAVVGGDASAPVTSVEVDLGGGTVAWRLRETTPVALVAGRLDGMLVAVAWRLPEGSAAPTAALPPGIPPDWQVAMPWEPPDAEAFAVRLRCEGGAPVACGLWRDVLHRPAADGISEWAVGPGEVWVLGDSPGVSHDSRSYGPIPRARLVAPVAGE